MAANAIGKRFHSVRVLRSFQGPSAKSHRWVVKCDTCSSESTINPKYARLTGCPVCNEKKTPVAERSGVHQHDGLYSVIPFEQLARFALKNDGALACLVQRVLRTTTPIRPEHATPHVTPLPPLKKKGRRQLPRPASTSTPAATVSP